MQNRDREKPLNTKNGCFSGCTKTRIFVNFYRILSIFDHWSAGIQDSVSFGARTENGKKNLVQINDFCQKPDFYPGKKW